MKKIHPDVISGEYGSTLCSVMLAKYLAYPDLEGDAIATTAGRCMARVTSPDVRKILTHLFTSTDPVMALELHIRGIEKKAGPVAVFLAAATTIGESHGSHKRR